jgi:hypothetical protein
MNNLTYDKDLHIFLDAEGNAATQEDILLWGAENPIVTFPNGKEEVVNIDDHAREIVDHMKRNNIDPSLIPDIASQMGQGQSAQDIIANLFNPKIPVQMPEQNVQEPLQSTMQPTDLITEDQNNGY